MSEIEELVEARVSKYMETGDPNFLFQKLEVLGIGSFGRVYKSLNVVTHDVVALKVVNLESLSSNSALKDLKNEITLLASCQCPNVVSYHCSFVTGEELLISMEFLGGGTITDLLRPGRFPDVHLRVVLREVLQGLAYLHHNQIVHRDLKPRNVMVTETGEVKLTDFGVASQLSRSKPYCDSLVGTSLYMAPEVILESAYGFEADIWSLGILAYEMATGNAPNDDLPAMDVMTNTVYMKAPRLPAGIFGGDLEDFVAVCLDKNKDVRPSSFDLLNHRALQVNAGPEILMDLIEEFQQWKEEYQPPVPFNQPPDSANSASMTDPFWDFDDSPSPTKTPKKSSSSKKKSRESSADDISSKRKRKPSLAANQRLSEDDVKQKKKKKRLSSSQVDLAQKTPTSSETSTPKSSSKLRGKSAPDLSSDSNNQMNLSMASIATSHTTDLPDIAEEEGKERKKKRRTKKALAPEGEMELVPEAAVVTPRPKKPKTKEGSSSRKSRSKSMIQEGSSPEKELYRVSSPDVGGSMVRVSEDVTEDDLAYEPFSQRRKTTMSTDTIPEFDEQGRRVSRASISYQARRERELSFVEGDVLKILPSSADADGAWVEAELEGRVGLVPAFVTRSFSLENMQDANKPKRVGPKKSFEELLAEVPESPPKPVRKRWSMVASLRQLFGKA